MLSVDEAQARVRLLAVRSQSQSAPLEACLGRVLATSIVTDRPTPPFDRACMDGYALCHSTAQSGEWMEIVGLARAGAPPAEAPSIGGVIEIATGAPLPVGCDCVVPYEKTDKRTEDSRELVRFHELPTVGLHVQACGSEAPKGHMAVAAGTVLRATEIGILASVGELTPQIFSQPRIAMCSTGDELVDPECIPLPHQIRRSNASAITSLLAQHGLTCESVCHAPDDPSALRQELSEMLKEHDVVLLTGGVSMGKWDYVPQILQALGVQEHIYKVAQKPGKPLWIGVGPTGQLVFALPGNPVAALVCARRWVLPVLERHLGAPTLQVKLSCEIKSLEKLTRFVVVQTQEIEATRWATPLPSQGSGDYLALAHSSGFCAIAPQQGTLPAGSLVEYFPW